MLSAFRAQPIYELKQQDKSKIESVLAYGNLSTLISKRQRTDQYRRPPPCRSEHRNTPNLSRQ